MNLLFCYVIAKNGDAEIGRTLIGHTAGPENSRTNAKKVIVSKESYSLSIGQTAKITAKPVKVKGEKKLLHGRKLRYLSSNPSVATVNENGQIYAAGIGTCDVWIYALNGKSRKVTVTVR